VHGGAERAMAMAVDAGERALLRYAHEEAAELLASAAEVLGWQPVPDPTLELCLLLTLGSFDSATRVYALYGRRWMLWRSKDLPTRLDEGISCSRRPRRRAAPSARWPRGRDGSSTASSSGASPRPISSSTPMPPLPG